MAPLGTTSSMAVQMRHWVAVGSTSPPPSGSHNVASPLHQLYHISEFKTWEGFWTLLRSILRIMAFWTLVRSMLRIMALKHCSRKSSSQLCSHFDIFLNRTRTLWESDLTTRIQSDNVNEIMLPCHLSLTHQWTLWHRALSVVWHCYVSSLSKCALFWFLIMWTGSIFTVMEKAERSSKQYSHLINPRCYRKPRPGSFYIIYLNQAFFGDKCMHPLSGSNTEYDFWNKMTLEVTLLWLILLQQPTIQ